MQQVPQSGSRQGREDKLFCWGMQIPSNISAAARAPVPNPALPASVLQGLIEFGSSQHQQSASFQDLGRGRYEGKKKWQRNRLDRFIPGGV